MWIRCGCTKKNVKKGRKEGGRKKVQREQNNEGKGRIK